MSQPAGLDSFRLDILSSALTALTDSSAWLPVGIVEGARSEVPAALVVAAKPGMLGPLGLAGLLSCSATTPDSRQILRVI